jgi:hypothetical protein
MDDPWHRADYTSYWRPPPLPPRRWPFAPFALLVLVVGVIVSALMLAHN